MVADSLSPLGGSGGQPPLARLSTDETVARRARQFVTGVLVRCGRPELAEVAALLVSELVANVWRHTSASTCTVRVGFPEPAGQAGGREGVVFEVCDAAADAPVEFDAEPHPSGEGGRGLRIVSALADEWGVRRSATQKSVWFRLTSPDW